MNFIGSKARTARIAKIGVSLSECSEVRRDLQSHTTTLFGIVGISCLMLAFIGFSTNMIRSSSMLGMLSVSMTALFLLLSVVSIHLRLRQMSAGSTEDTVARDAEDCESEELRRKDQALRVPLQSYQRITIVGVFLFADAICATGAIGFIIATACSPLLAIQYGTPLFLLGAALGLLSLVRAAVLGEAGRRYLTR